MSWCMAGGQPYYGFSMQCIHEKKTFCIFFIFASDIIICYLCESYNSEHTEPEFGVFLAYLQRIETEQQ